MEKKKAMKWVKALRSGKFKQIKGSLIALNNDKPTGYCCLGVLCEVSGIPLNHFKIHDALYGDLNQRCGISDGVGHIKETKSVSIYDINKKKIQLRIGNKYKSFVSLSEANDEGASFKSIASWIEKNYKLL